MRDYISVIFIACFFFFMIPFEGSSQPVLTSPGNLAQNQVFVTIGLEPEMVTTIGYMHYLGSRGKNLDLYAGGSLKFAPLIISTGAWRANLITAVDYRISSDWGTRFTTAIYNAHDRNRASTMDGLGFELRAAPVHYGEKWITGFDVGWQYTAVTHINHSTVTKGTFEKRYPTNNRSIDGPKDGWYRATVSRFRVGFVGSNKLNDHWGLQFGIGSLVFIQKQGIILGFSHAQVPLYFNTQVNYGW